MIKNRQGYNIHQPSSMNKLPGYTRPFFIYFKQKKKKSFSFSFHSPFFLEKKMGQATSKKLRQDTLYDYKDISNNKFTKATFSTLAVPMVIIAFPLLNAYTFTEEELTGFKLMDSMLGGLVGVIGWPLAPFLACYGVFQVLFKDGPTEPLPIPSHIKEAAKRSIGLNCEQFYNVAVIGVTGKVSKK
jgi:hypothetical protein